ncbi:hypothetical protein niasHS_001280 [Heterodera schachtii]|uniref:Uncharacterized protein n=1 Tax=Heterodera schachtii TaxID=97005 RepID=A0ABD2KIP4_HETSC
MSLPPCLGGTLNTSNRNTNTNLYHELLDATLAQQESGGGRVETDDEQLAARLQAEEYGGTTSEGIGGTLNTSNRNTNTNLYHELLDANLAQQESGGGRVETDDEQLAARLQAEEYVKVLIDQVKVLINQVKVQMNNKLIALFVCLKFHQMNKSKNYPANTNFTLLALIDGLLKTHLARSVAPALVGEEAAAALHPHKIGQEDHQALIIIYHQCEECHHMDTISLFIRQEWMAFLFTFLTITFIIVIGQEWKTFLCKFLLTTSIMVMVA